MNNIKPITMENVLSELEGITAIMNFLVNDLGDECACLDGAATQAYLAKRVNLLYAPALYHIFDSLNWFVRSCRGNCQMSKAQTYSELLRVIRRNRGNEKFLHFALMRAHTLEKLLTRPDCKA